MKGIFCKYEFDSEAIREMIQNIFTESEIEVVVKPYSIDARFNNGNSFHISIHNEKQIIYSNCRRKYTSLKPNWEENYSLESEVNVNSLFQVIKYILTSLN